MTMLDALKIKNKALQAEIVLLRNDNDVLDKRRAKLQERIVQYESENNRLLEMLNELKRAQFGSKKEVYIDKTQLGLFNEAEAAVATDAQDTKAAVIEVPAHTKARGHRKALPDNLPREVKRIELPPEERFSADGTALIEIGVETSEKVVIEPARAHVLEVQRVKYGIDHGDYVKTAPVEPSIIPQSIATAETLATIVTNKYADGLPLYRQEEILNRYGIYIPRSTMGRWIVQAAALCREVLDVLNKRVLSSDIVCCDETHTQVLKENGRSAESKSWMWVRSANYKKKAIVIFSYFSSRSGEVVRGLFENFEGYIQVDGYKAYNVLAENAKIIEIGCNMHGRRYFEKAYKTGAKEGVTLAEVALKYYAELFKIEDEIKDSPHELRHKIRHEKSKPVWSDFKSWADLTRSKVPPKSKIGQALNYFCNEYDELTGYLKDGRLEIDNGFVERAIRKFAIGRNNWMFSDTVAGAEASALFYSLVVTAKVNHQDPYRMLKILFDQIPKAKAPPDYERLADLVLGIPSPTALQG